MSHEAVADRIAWHDADVHLILALNLSRVPESLGFSSKPWSHMRAIAVTQRAGFDTVDVHVLDGTEFDVEDPRSWASYIVCEQQHARPVIAPPAFRGVVGSLTFLNLAAARGVRVITQRSVPWDVMLREDGCDGRNWGVE